MMAEKWHVNSEVSIGHIISTILLIALIIAGWDNLSDRVDKSETRIELLEKADRRQVSNFNAMRISIDKKLDRICDKIDRVIERMIDGNGKVTNR